MENSRHKFRAWDVERKIWVEPKTFMILGTGKILSEQTDGFKYELMQFTGLKDKNGKDIYEGDILTHHKYNGNHAVKWLDESTGFFLGNWALTLLCTPNIEIIGNIYENPNLLSEAI